MNRQKMQTIHNRRIFGRRILGATFLGLAGLLIFVILSVYVSALVEQPGSSKRVEPAGTRISAPRSESAPQLQPQPDTTRTSGAIARIRALIAAKRPSESRTRNHQVLVLPLIQSQRPDGSPTAEVSPTLTPTTITAPAVIQPTPTPPVNVAAVTPHPPGGPLRVPILMYHYVSEPPEDADIYRRDLSVTPELFAAHLNWFAANGYTTISLYDLFQALSEGSALPSKPVILTFDDGYRDQYENAFFPLLQRGMTATFFVVTDFMDEEREEYLTWEMAREMLAGGMSIESHGRNHVSLQNQDEDYLIWQALGSLETIEFELGRRPYFVSYPAGQYDEETIRIFASAGYRAGVTTQQGATHLLDNAFEMRRIRIRGTTTVEDLARLVTLDW